MLKKLAALLLPVTLVVACGSPSSDGGTSGDGDEAPSSGGVGASVATGGESGDDPMEGSGGENSSVGDDSLLWVCHLLASAQSFRVAECSHWNPSGLSDIPFPSCPDVLFSEGSTRPQTVAEAESCAEEWAQFSCQDLYDGKLPSCVTPGTLAADAPCVYSSQCASLNCSSWRECGKCLPVGDGETCGPELACPGMKECVGGKCESSLPDPSVTSEPQIRGAVDEECPCQEGLICAPLSLGQPWACRSPRVDGQPCLQLHEGETLGDYDCGDGLLCDANKICRSRASVGNSCLVGLGGGVFCEEGAGCSDQGICVEASVGGQPCLSYGDGSTLCAEGYVCRDAICQKQLGYLDACTEAYAFCPENAPCQNSVCSADDSLDDYALACGL
jgi:hypothetical protein